MGWFKGRVSNEVVVIPSGSDVDRPLGPLIDLNGSAALVAGVGQQVGAIGPNQAFEIEHIVTQHGQKIRFAKVAIPPMLQPMLSYDLSAEARKEDDDKRHKKVMRHIKELRELIERDALRQAGAFGANQKLEVDGIPCMLRKTDNGYDLMRITQAGQLEFVAHLGVKV